MNSSSKLKHTRGIKMPLAAKTGMKIFGEFRDIVGKKLGLGFGRELISKTGDIWKQAKLNVKDPKDGKSVLEEAKRIFNKSIEFEIDYTI